MITRFVKTNTSRRQRVCPPICILLALLISSTFLNSCSKDAGPLDVGESKFYYSAYGSGNNSSSDLYYPHHKGYTVAYTNTLRTYVTDSTYQDSAAGCDTLKTLGFLHTFVNGDSLFAVTLKYPVSSNYAGHASVTLYCAPPSGSFAGAFCMANASIAGKQSLCCTTTNAADLTLSPVYGRLRM